MNAICYIETDYNKMDTMKFYMQLIVVIFRIKFVEKLLSICFFLTFYYFVNILKINLQSEIILKKCHFLLTKFTNA